MKTYEIVQNGEEQDIIYYIDGIKETQELYSQPGFIAEIREGYILKTN